MNNLFVDLDGVVVDHSGNIDILALDNIKLHNDNVIINTGRLMHDVDYIVNTYNLSHTYKIAQNGAVILNSDNQVILEHNLEYDTVKKIVDLYKNHDEVRLEINTYKNRYFMSKRPSDFPKEFVDTSQIVDFSDIVDKHIFNGILIISDKASEIISDIKKEINDDSVNIVQTSNTSIEVFNKKASKGNAIKYLIENNLISGKTYGFGDSESDISMMENVDFPYCIGNNKDLSQKCIKSFDSLYGAINEIR